MSSSKVIEFAGGSVPSVEMLVHTARALASMKLAGVPSLQRQDVADAMGEELLLIARDHSDPDVAFHLGQVAMLIRTDARGRA